MTATLNAEKAMQESMRALITPRVLSPEQIANMKEKLKEYQDTPFDFAVTDDLDAKRLLMQVGTMLLDSGWLWGSPPTLSGFTLGFDNGHQAAELSFDGLSIDIAESQRSKLEKPALALLNGLLGAGIKAGANSTPDDKINVAFDKKSLHIIIGKR